MISPFFFFSAKDEQIVALGAGSLPATILSIFFFFSG